jgi:hypothetical protein
VPVWTSAEGDGESLPQEQVLEHERPAATERSAQHVRSSRALRLSRRIAFYKCVALVQGANLVRRELGLPEAPVPAADPRFAFGTVPQE